MSDSPNSSTTSSTTPPAPEVIRHWTKLARLKQWTGLLGVESLQAEKDRQQKNLAAEDRFVRRQLWGATDDDSEPEDPMRHTILGDVTQAPPVIFAPPSKSSGLGTVAALMLGMAIPAAGVGGFLLREYLTETPAPVVDPGDDQLVDFGLGRISDYLEKHPEGSP